METQNQPVACQCSGVLKGITVACAVLAVVLPWFGMMAALIGILLAVVSIVCAIIAVCKKATMFGIIMIVVGMIAGGIATGGYLFSVAKDLNLVDQGKIQVEFAKKNRGCPEGRRPEEGGGAEEGAAGGTGTIFAESAEKVR